ncbi:MAG: hypothetical protein D6737_07100 [Chloroflexi bacterium]|nr:MAG: hypothetical protein D6737_07100 [Chloroflexota bacterium]
MTLSRYEKYTWILLIPLLLIVTWRAGVMLNGDAVRIPELITLAHVGLGEGGQSPIDVWHSVRELSPAHTPGYFVLINFWGSLVGWSAPALRVFSLYAGILAVALTYRLGHDMLSRRAGFYAAFAMSVSSFLIFYLHELRMYSLVVLLTALVLWLYWRSITTTQQPQPIFWISLFLATLASVYTHFTALFPLGAIALYHLIFVPKTKRWVYVSLAMGAAGLLFLPFFAAIGLEKFNSLGHVQHASTRGSLNAFELTYQIIDLFSNGSPALLMIVGALTIITLPKALGQSNRNLKMLWFIVVITVLAILVANQIATFIPPRRSRYLLPLWPLIALMVALGISQLERWRYVPLVALILWGTTAATASFKDTTNMTDEILTAQFIGPNLPLHRVAHEIEQRAQPGSILLYATKEIELPKFDEYRGLGAYYFSDLKAKHIESFFVDVADQRPPDEISDSVLIGIGARQEVWLAYSPLDSTETVAIVQDALSPLYDLCAHAVMTNDLYIEQYVRSGLDCVAEAVPVVDSPLIQFDEDITLNEVIFSTDVAEKLAVVAEWSVAEDVPPDTYAVSFQMFNSDGNKVEQVDYMLRDYDSEWESTLIPIGNLPAGDYDVYVAVYEFGTTQAISGIDTRQGESNEIFFVQPITLPGN